VVAAVVRCIVVTDDIDLTLCKPVDQVSYYGFPQLLLATLSHYVLFTVI